MSRKARILLPLAALLLFIAFVVARMPAATGMALLARQSSGAILPYQPSGTIWDGKAQSLFVQYNGQMLDLGETRWQVKAWDMLLGRMTLKIDARNGRQKVAGNISAAVTGSLTLTDFEAGFDIARIMQLFPVPFRAEGFVDIMLNEAALSPGEVSALDGNIVVKNLVFNFTHPVELGTYAARLSLDGKAVKAAVSDIDATVAVDGTASVILSERQYKTDMTLKPAANADPAIAQTLRAVARQNSDGVFVMKRDGNF